jgi:hypothetical protein
MAIVAAVGAREKHPTESHMGHFVATGGSAIVIAWFVVASDYEDLLVRAMSSFSQPPPRISASWRS